MNIEIKDCLTLNDNKTYTVVSKANWQNKVYYLLVDIDCMENILFCYGNEQRKSMIEEKDKETIRRLLPLFLENVPKEIKEAINKIMAKL